MPLEDQSAVLFCAVYNLPQVNTHQLTGKSQTFIYKMYKSLDECRRMDVVWREKSIAFGDPGARSKLFDCEADEVDLAKETDEGMQQEDANTKWEQWAGILQRGDSKKLKIFRTRASRTCRRAPGPGAIKLTDWAPRAKKELKDKNVVLHTDGARAYHLEVDGMHHDHVVHKKRQLMKNGKPVKRHGKTVWLNSQYTKTFTHKTQTGRKIMCKGGTQIIDRFWQHIRRYLKCRSHPVGSAAMATRIRSAQWAYWHRGDDLWLETGQMLAIETGQMLLLR